MQAVLIATLLLILPLSSERHDVIRMATYSADTIVRLRACWIALYGKFPVEAMHRELHHYSLGLHSEDSPTSQEERSVLVSDWPVREVLNFRRFLSFREVENLGEVGCTVEDDSISALRNSLAILDKLYRETQLGPEATFGDLAEGSRGRVYIPVIGQAVYVEEATRILGVAIVVLLIYLVSLLRALKAATVRKFQENAMDWIFLHPGILGVLIGAIWLFLPTAIMISAIIRETVSLSLGVTLVVGLATCAGWAFYQALVVRKAVSDILAGTQD